jgi:hypothetical protein
VGAVEVGTSATESLDPAEGLSRLETAPTRVKRLRTKRELIQIAKTETRRDEDSPLVAAGTAVPDSEPSLVVRRPTKGARRR